MEAVADRLLERDRELAALGDLLRDARAGDGRVAVLRGPPGIGKTALVEVACGLADDAGFRILAARGAELEREFPFGLARQLFEPVLRRLPEHERAEAMSGAAGLCEHALGFSRGAPAGDASASPAALHGLYWLCANLAERSPLLLVVDDAHWGDLPSLRWLCYLANRLDGIAVVALVATRLGRHEPVGPLIDELGRERDARVLAPAPLSEAGVRRLMEGTFGSAPDAEFVRACHGQSAGNPLLVRELVKAIVAEGARPDVDAAARVLAVPPQDALRAVLVRLGRLPAAASALARAVAVLETSVELRDAAALAGLGESAASQAADELAAAGIFEQDVSPRFVHPLLRAAVYDDIPQARRASDHARAAALLRSDPAARERVTAHLLACEPTGEGWVIDYLRAAARAALSRGAAETAVAVLERCLAERPDPAVRPGIVRELGMAERRIAALTAVEHLREAHETAPDAPERIAISRELAAALVGVARVSDAYELLEQSRAEVPADDRELALAIEAELLAVGLIGPRVSERVKERIDRIPRLSGQTPGERLVLANLARHRDLRGASVQDAADIAERAIAGGQLLFDQTPDSPTFMAALIPLVTAGRLETVQQLADHAIADAEERGSPLGLAMAAAVMASVELFSGRLWAAESEAQRAVELGWQTGFLPCVTVASRVLVEVALARGQPDIAEAALNDNHLGGELPDMFVFFNFPLYARGCLRLAQGRTADGIADLLDVGERERAAGQVDLASPWRSQVAPALATSGEPDRAWQLATEELAIARGCKSAGTTSFALRAVAQLEGGRAGIEHLREAVSILDPTPFTLWRMHALVDLGAALRRSNERAEAREHLRRALDLAHRCGAGAIAERARQELLATGARPRNVVLTGVEALTPSERRVAELAARGMTNKQIAQALFVTRKTVGTHLEHAYAKLDINTRTELPAKLGARR